MQLDGTRISSPVNTTGTKMPDPRILVVEDEATLQAHLVSLISSENFSVFTCSTFRELEHTLDVAARFDVIVLDRLLNGHDSAQLVGKIKAKHPGARIIVLSAIDTAAEKASLLDAGADDYISKPFDGNELIARIKAMLRRTEKNIVFGNVTLKVEARALLVNGKDFPLTNKEYLLLKALLASPSKIINKNELYSTVWDMSPDVDSNVVEVTVNKLRKRLQEMGASIVIKNTRNAGYWIEV